MKKITLMLFLLILSSCNSIGNGEAPDNIARSNALANNMAAVYSKSLKESKEFHEGSLVLINAFKDCSMKRSAQLLNSNEGAREIALAATGYCQKYFDDASTLHLMAKKKGGLTLSSADEFQDRKFLDEIHSTILDKLTGAIVNARASLKGSSPSPRSGTATPTPQTPSRNNNETPI